jgi:hypothetical protein
MSLTDFNREGDEAAELSEKNWNSAGQAAVGGLHAVTIVATGTVKGRKEI